jgi:hypothetical protein
MKDPAKSLLAVKSAASRSTSDTSRAVAAVQARAYDDALFSLVRLLARQAARDWVEQQLEHASTAPVSLEEDPR